MILDKPLTGSKIRLRTAHASDAEFILGLRLDAELSQFLKPIDPSVENQRSWIEQKKEQPGDYHMIVETLDGKSVGVIALYAIKDGMFDWGRWIFSRNAPFFAPLESMVILYNFAFNTLGLRETRFENRLKNERVQRFHQQYGARPDGTDKDFQFFRFSKSDFDKNAGMQRLVAQFKTD